MAKDDLLQELIVSLKGAESDKHEVPAFTALDTAHAVSQALMMIVNYAQTGEIRRRNFKDLDIQINLKTSQPGSFEFVFEFSNYAPYLIDAYGKGLADASWKLIETVFNRATGVNGGEKLKRLRMTDV